MNLEKYLSVTPEIQAALAEGKPVVALESTILSHGMPYPQNLDFGRKVEQIIRDEGCVPATIAILDGKMKVGLNEEELERMCHADGVGKVSRRDLATYLATGMPGATTVTTTEFRDYGIEVLAIETKRIDLPDENKAAVYERMISERGNIAASYEAQGNAEAKRIRNEADKTVDITISEANSQSEKLKAAGEAEYMRILSEVYDTPEEADFYEFMRALDMAQKALVGGNKTLVVSSDSPIAKIFSGQWGQAE